jgi:hypothetical protein
MNRMKILLTILCIAVAGSAFSQAFPEDSLTKKFDAYRKQALQEKVYVRTDRGTYLTGELMWFKVYCVDGFSNKPLDISKVVYVEMLGEDNEPVLQRKIEMRDGIGSGSMFVPVSLSVGNYKIRAYTNWMKNFSPDFYFHAPVSIVNTFVKPIAPAKGTPVYDAQFFPEGGDLVAGIRSKVAFRVIDKSGKGISFRGAILDERNDTVARFKPLKFGIGSFYMTPTASKYKAIIIDEAGHRSSYNLRDVKETGFSIRLTETGDAITIGVTTLSQQESGMPVYLFAQCRQSIVSKDSRTLQNGKAEFKINRSDLPPGITHITVFDRNLQPVAERLYFKKIEPQMNVDSKTEIVSYNTRSRLRLRLNTDADANVSVSVFKNDSIPTPIQSNLFEYLWLTSELKGTIESPEYYLSSTDTTVARAVDNLMLTHGWRRFNWTAVLKSKPSFTHVPEYRNHIIRGKVTNTVGQPVNGALTYLASPQLYVRPFGSRSDANGNIQFEVKDFYGSKKIMVQTNQRIDSTSIIKIDNPFSEQYAEWPAGSVNLPSNIGKQLLDRSVAMQVQDVYFRDQVNHFIAPPIDTVPFYGHADEVYNLDEYTRFPIMEEVLREYVPGVLVRKKRDGFHFMVVDQVNKNVFREDPMILIDGVPVFNANEVINFSPLKIKRLDVLSREYYEGIMTLPGMMSFFTYANDLGGFPIDERVVTMTYDGLQVQREFYSPRYENVNDKQARLPDPRTLLYWNPTLNTKKGETSEIEFYTSDVSGNFTVFVEGISKDGKAGSGYSSFSVSKISN